MRGAVTGMTGRAISAVNEFSKNATGGASQPDYSVDMPSGLPSDGEAAEGPVLRAHQTVTFTAPKIGQLVSVDAACTGALEVRQIGSPAELVEELGKGELRWGFGGRIRGIAAGAGGGFGTREHLVMCCWWLGR